VFAAFEMSCCSLKDTVPTVILAPSTGNENKPFRFLWLSKYAAIPVKQNHQVFSALLSPQISRSHELTLT
jgi:hypothetical protein